MNENSKLEKLRSVRLLTDQLLRWEEDIQNSRRYRTTTELELHAVRGLSSALVIALEELMVECAERVGLINEILD